MIVAYNIGVDGWTPCQTDRAPVLRDHGPIKISDYAWGRLSLKDRGLRGDCIPCEMHFTDTEHLIAVAAYIDRQAET